MKTVVIIMLLLAVSLAQQGPYNVEKCLLTVYRDGVVHIYLKTTVDELEPYITLPLLSSPDKIYNVLVLDENNETLVYDYGENNTIIIYTLGAKQVKIEYDTSRLTSMEYGLWKLKIIAPFSLTIRLPEDAIIIYINAPPTEIRPIDKQIEITLNPGDWEINYEIPITPPTPGRPPAIPDYLKYYIIAGVCVACISIILAVYIKRRRVLGSLSDEEMEVLRFIRERGGRALEAELRERFSHIPRTSMWRLIRRLEKRGIVQVRKVGLQNVVELK